METHYAIIDKHDRNHGIITNVVVCDDPDFAAAEDWYLIPPDMVPQPWIGWTYDHGTWTPPPPDE